jgi:streptogramin lyase
MLNLPLRALTPLLLAAGLTAQVGSYLGSFPAPAGATPVGLGASPTGELLMTAPGGVLYRMDTAGNVLAQFTLSDTGSANGATSDGINYYVSDSNATRGKGIDVYDAGGNYIQTFATTAFFPAGIVWSPMNNHLYMVDRTGAQVFEYDTAGNLVAQFPLQAQQNDGIGYDISTNSFWVYELTGDQLVNYDTTFQTLQMFPGTQSTPIGALGRGASFVGGLIYVSVQSARVIAIFDATGTSASANPYGNGCPTPGCFYEQFTTAGSSDLSGRAFTFRANGPRGWTATVGGTFETNIGPGLNHADDQIDRAVPLGFNFPVVGSSVGTTNAIDISSNGWVSFIPNEIPDTGFYVGATGDKFIQYARIATWWDDLDPSVAGDTHFTTLSNPTRAVITWDGVPQFGANPPDSNTIQLQLYPNGDWTIIYQAGCTDEAITGFSSGAVPTDPGSIDLTASIPRNFGPYGATLGLTSTRPILGNALTYQVDNIPTGTSFAVVLFGSAQVSNPLDPVGITGCTLLCSADLAAAPVSLATGQFGFSVPNQPGLAGASLFNQALAVSPGFNPAAIILSNGLQLRLGN